MEGIWDSIVGWAKENLSELTMVKVYLGCAIAGGTVLASQFGLTFFGLGGETDVDPDMDVDAMDGDGGGLHILSVRGLSGFLTIFGLTGWGGISSGWGPGVTLAVSSFAGSIVMVLIALAMRFMMRQQSSGNIRAENAVGQTARVYLKIPANGSGKGKITVSIQGRSCEFAAESVGPELPTGTACTVVRQVTEDTFQVGPLE